MYQQSHRKISLLRAFSIPVIGLLFLFTVANVVPVINLPFGSKVSSACAQSSPNLTVNLLSIRNVAGQSYSDNTVINPGEAVFFQIEVHNTVEGSTADNATIRVEFPTGEGTSFTPRVFLSANNAGTVSDTTNVTLTSPGRLVFNSGSVGWHWDPDGDGDFDFDGPVSGGDSLLSNGINAGPLQGCNAFIIQMSFSATAEATQVTPTPTPTPTSPAPTATPTPTSPAPTATPTPTGVAPTATPTPTSGAAPTATPTQAPAGGNVNITNTNTNNNNNTNNNTQNQNVTVSGGGQPAVVLGATAPSAQPKSGPESVLLAGLFGLLPIGVWLKRRSRNLEG